MTTTPEQERARREIVGGAGQYVIVANAGTGKTYLLSLIFLGVYLAEEARRFRRNSHVSGRDQLSLLQQICAYTFTREAAAVFNGRILEAFQRECIPAPVDEFGRPYRICRTIDSYLIGYRGWLKHPAFFEAWLKEDPDLQNSLASTLAILPKRALEALSAGCADVGLCHALFKKLNWLAGDTVQHLLIEAVIREQQGMGSIPGLSPFRDWPHEWEDFLGNYELPADRMVKWGAEFWAGKVAQWREYQSEMRSRFEFLTGLSGPAHATMAGKKLILPAEVEEWRHVAASRRDFMAVYEIARAKGYHPSWGVGKLARMSVLNELAASERISSFGMFQDLAMRFYTAKVRYHVMDHSDCLNSFVEVLEKPEHRHLLERNKEYPVRGLRSKIVLGDEKQDDNVNQNRLGKLLTPYPGVPGLSVSVGDPKQAVYAFRGANSFGFAAAVDYLRRFHPERLFPLTCSFRSAKKIVELGNEVVQTLPAYRKTVYPSMTIFEDEGLVLVAPPLCGEKDEARWVVERIRLIRESDPAGTIMLLHRQRLERHPIWNDLQGIHRGEENLQAHTVHSAKGLEADYVIVMGLTAGLFPDPRNNFTQEVNLFYVACTRARKILVLVAPIMRTTLDQDGQAREVEAGPSPFFRRLPTLSALADKSGWPSEMIERGERVHSQALAVYLARVEQKGLRLRSEWREIFPDRKLAADEEECAESGSAPPTDEIRRLPKRSLFVDGKIVQMDEGGIDAMLRERVREKCRAAWLKNGDTLIQACQLDRRFTKAEQAAGWRAGFFRRANGREVELSPWLVESLRKAILGSV